MPCACQHPNNHRQPPDVSTPTPQRSIPCKRCLRLGLKCVPNPRPRGRPKKSDRPPEGGQGVGRDRGSRGPSSVASGWSGMGEATGAAQHYYQPPMPGFVGPAGLGHDPFGAAAAAAAGAGGHGSAIGAFLEGGALAHHHHHPPHGAAVRPTPMPPGPGGPQQGQGYYDENDEDEEEDRSLSSYQSSSAGYPEASPPSAAAPATGPPAPPPAPPGGMPGAMPPHMHPHAPQLYPAPPMPHADLGAGGPPPPYAPLEGMGVGYPPNGARGLPPGAGNGTGPTQQQPPLSMPGVAGPPPPMPQAGPPAPGQGPPPMPGGQPAGQQTASAAGGADPLALKMMGPFVSMLSAGEVAVERSRHLL